ncbi:LysR family transcriptional regulator [Aquirufa novilacunae]|jgi:DNA-binding transcriptional LysR family regulator|uniref:LysR family transcriptional regulator n=1 Tax=Aquirufa novilacunae TaxID=3139305 RepID=A0ABW8U0E4_9BACT
MNYTLNQLQIFVKVVQTSSITKAAEELNLTQPAVSIQIKNFQAQFEIPLLEIIGKKIYVTDFGKEIAASAEGILEQVYAINYKTMAFKDQLIGRLKVSIVSTGKYVLPYYLSDFLKANPGVEISIDVTNRGKVIESLEQNEVDFSLVSDQLESTQFDFIDILKNELVLVGNTETAAMNPSFDYNTFKHELPLIFRESGSGTRKIMESYLKKQGVSSLKRIELMSNEAVKQAVMAGLGYSIMPLIGIKREIKDGYLAIIPREGLPITTDWKLIWHKEKKPSPVAKAFMNFVLENNERIKQSFFN